MRAKKNVNIEIGQNIQAARDKAGYTQEKLSEVLGITPNHLSAVERGAAGISLEALQRLCRTLGITADYVLFGTQERDSATLELADQLSKIKPEYKPQVKKIVSALLEMSAVSSK